MFYNSNIIKLIKLEGFKDAKDRLQFTLVYNKNKVMERWRFLFLKQQLMRLEILSMQLICFALKELGPIYTRLTNPTTDVLEQRFAALEGGAAAICVSSGQKAIFTIANVAETGDNIIISDKLYGGAVTLLTHN